MYFSVDLGVFCVDFVLNVIVKLELVNHWFFKLRAHLFAPIFGSE